MYECESWTIKKTEHQRIDAFELWCWRTLLIVPWTVRRFSQSILMEIIPEYLFEGLMLKLKLQDVGHLMWRTDSLEKTLMLGKIEGLGGGGEDREWDGWMASPIQWMYLSKLWERVKAWEEEGRIENEMVGWHHQFNGCIWVNSGSWWWTGRPGVLQSMGSQIVGYNWVTEMNLIELNWYTM